ncbi:MAG: PIN domain-containing protein [Planctomycetes bacterium]|nr:PIN domain-containing protein [Planctomycetota bacterium]
MLEGPGPGSSCEGREGFVGLIRDLGPSPTAVDTVAFIYFIEEHPDYLPLLEPVFSQVARGEREVVSSCLTLLEVLVVPYRAGNQPLAHRYEALLTGSRGVRLVEIDRRQLRAGAQLRAVHKVKTPDALQIAAALSTGCKVFLTNDRGLPNISGLQVLELGDYLRG